jgi:hypothetical protein
MKWLTLIKSIILGQDVVASLLLNPGIRRLEPEAIQRC